MATKWKNKWKIIAWLFLFIFGLSSTLSGINSLSYYAKGSFFQTDEFENSYLNPFLQRLVSLELDNISSEDLKKQITVTTSEIEEHRNRYGNVDEQVESIKSQYEDAIQAAKNTNDKQLEQKTIAERDTKIQDIMENFRDDEHVRKKIVKEKEELVDVYYNALEKERATFSKEKKAFSYYFKDVQTGKVYTNMPVSSNKELNAFLKKEKALFQKSFTNIDRGSYIQEV
ncbi:MAG: sensor histidine kinase, partial [Bacillaceae bacterium]